MVTGLREVDLIHYKSGDRTARGGHDKSVERTVKGGSVRGSLLT